ncbi:MAG: hypothetical protein NTW80_05195 [Deltaproteobacteria bacterium]|nr:hypothetical protein [Deltaproteobacteria bacterium]
MEDKPESDLASQMKVARELLEEGEVREALVLAMEVLWRELDQLQDTLKTVEESLPQNQEAPESSGFVWPETLSQLLH